MKKVLSFSAMLMLGKVWKETLLLSRFAVPTSLVLNLILTGGFVVIVKRLALSTQR